MNAFIILNTLLFLVAELELANKLIFILFYFFFLYVGAVGFTRIQRIFCVFL